MTSRALLALTCDRCKAKGNSDDTLYMEDTGWSAWGRITVEKYKPSNSNVGQYQRVVPPPERAGAQADLCPPCYSQIMQWWGGSDAGA
jgi:hypothetical protein